MKNIIWTECGSEGNPGSRLLADVPRLVIAGVNMHVQAYEVVYRRPDGSATDSGEGGLQDIADEEFREDWEAIGALYEFCFEVMQYEGREYVLIAHPHGD